MAKKNKKPEVLNSKTITPRHLRNLGPVRAWHQAHVELGAHYAEAHSKHGNRKQYTLTLTLEDLPVERKKDEA